MYMTDEQALHEYVREQEKLAPMVNTCNDIFRATEQAKNYGDIVNMRNAIKSYIQKWPSDEYRIKEMRNRFNRKIAELIEENQQGYQKSCQDLQTLKSVEYDYSKEPKQYDAYSVQLRTKQLISQLPSNPAKINREINIGIISDTIDSGVIGSRAVAELMELPKYSELVSESMRKRAYEGSNSDSQKTFEHEQDLKIQGATKAQAKYINELQNLGLVQKGIMEKANADSFRGLHRN